MKISVVLDRFSIRVIFPWERMCPAFVRMRSFTGALAGHGETLEKWWS